jgi:hypothetical protein
MMRTGLKGGTGRGTHLMGERNFPRKCEGLEVSHWWRKISRRRDRAFTLVVFITVLVLVTLPTPALWIFFTHILVKILDGGTFKIRIALKGEGTGMRGVREAM